MEDIEFRDRNKPPEEDPARQEETSFWDSPPRREQIWDRLPDTPRFEPTQDFSRVDAQRDELDRMNEEVEKSKQDLRDFLDEKLNVKTSQNAGTASKKLYKFSKLVANKKKR